MMTFDADTPPDDKAVNEISQEERGGKKREPDLESSREDGKKIKPNRGILVEQKVKANVK